MLGEDDNISDNFGYYKEKEYILKKQDKEEDHINLVGESSDIESCVRNILSRHTL